MAIQTRRYVLKGPAQSELHQFVDPSANVVERNRTNVLTVEYDDAILGIVDTLDAYMDQQGLDSANPTPQKLPGYVSGLVPSYISTSVVQIGVGQCKAKNDKDDLIVVAPIGVDIAVIGVNGLDVGPEAANSWYFIYAIGDSTGVSPVAGILSASQNNPTFPVGYDIARRVGSVRNQGGDFRPFEVTGTSGYRQVQYRDALTSRQRLTGGANTVVTAVNLGSVVPNTSTVARVQIGQRGIVDAWIYDDPTQPIATYQRLVRPGLVITDEMRVSAGRDIGYANAAVGGLVDIYVTGYQESI